MVSDNSYENTIFRLGKAGMHIHFKCLPSNGLLYHRETVQVCNNYELKEKW